MVHEPKQMTMGLFRRKLCFKRASGTCRLVFRGLSWVIVGLWVHISHLYSEFQPPLVGIGSMELLELHCSSLGLVGVHWSSFEAALRCSIELI